jgi:hypothetical protein
MPTRVASGRFRLMRAGFRIGMYHIERALRYLKPMVGNRARIEGCIAKTFMLKEVADFSSVNFVEEHNVSDPMMQYNVDEEPHCSDLSIFCIEGHNYW